MARRILFAGLAPPPPATPLRRGGRGGLDLALARLHPRPRRLGGAPVPRAVGAGLARKPRPSHPRRRDDPGRGHPARSLRRADLAEPPPAPEDTPRTERRQLEPPE